MPVFRACSCSSCAGLASSPPSTRCPALPTTACSDLRPKLFERLLGRRHRASWLATVGVSSLSNTVGLERSADRRTAQLVQALMGISPRDGFTLVAPAGLSDLSELAADAWSIVAYWCPAWPGSCEDAVTPPLPPGQEQGQTRYRPARLCGRRKRAGPPAVWCACMVPNNPSSRAVWCILSRQLRQPRYRRHRCLAPR